MSNAIEALWAKFPQETLTSQVDQSKILRIEEATQSGKSDQTIERLMKFSQVSAFANEIRIEAGNGLREVFGERDLSELTPEEAEVVASLHAGVLLGATLLTVDGGIRRHSFNMKTFFDDVNDATLGTPLPRRGVDVPVTSLIVKLNESQQHSMMLHGRLDTTYANFFTEWRAELPTKINDALARERFMEISHMDRIVGLWLPEYTPRAQLLLAR